ncbi:MAG: tetraacyldisaccharide 4'-kinase [Candidatus Omnitrophica bacterium]|nr:tetraacyldisaccharide 4'-kinase [Candidatus Omnitrophota bacterium]
MSFKNYMLSVMKDDRNDAPARCLKVLLSFLSLFYAAAVKVVDLGYRSGLRRVHKVPGDVISIGNITLGGTGKTPFTVFIADKALSYGRKPAILIRGYGKDEDRMLLDELPDIRVIPGQDRVRNAAKASAEGCDLMILDDGFQHRRLARDLDIVLLDGTCWPGRAHLFPRGPLREPETALRRADVLVITRADLMRPEDRAGLGERLRKSFPGKIIVSAGYKALCLTDVTGCSYPVEMLKGTGVLPVCGIGNPFQFLHMLERLGCRFVSKKIYPDHYRYSRKDLDEIEGELSATGARYLVTTAKDMTKLGELDLSAFEEKILVLKIAVKITEGEKELDAGLDSLFNGKRT